MLPKANRRQSVAVTAGLTSCLAGGGPLLMPLAGLREDWGAATGASVRREGDLPRDHARGSLQWEQITGDVCPG